MHINSNVKAHFVEGDTPLASLPLAMKPQTHSNLLRLMTQDVRRLFHECRGSTVLHLQHVQCKSNPVRKASGYVFPHPGLGPANLPSRGQGCCCQIDAVFDKGHCSADDTTLAGQKLGQGHPKHGEGITQHPHITHTGHLIFPHALRP